MSIELREWCYVCADYGRRSAECLIRAKLGPMISQRPSWQSESDVQRSRTLKSRRVRQIRAVGWTARAA